MKYYVVLVTGGDYFLTPCVIIKAKDEETAAFTLREHNKGAYRQYSIALDRVTAEEEGAHIAETPDDIAYAF